MKFKGVIGSFATASLFMTMAGSAFADETADFFNSFNPVVQHEIIDVDENSNHALKAQARVTVPAGVTIDSGDFTWVINMQEDPLNPISNSIKNDSSKDETDNISDDNASKADTASNANAGDITFVDDNDIDNIGDDNSSDKSSTLEGESYVSRVKAKGGTTITGECEVTFGLIIELDIPLAEDKFDIDLEASPSSLN